MAICVLAACGGDSSGDDDDISPDAADVTPPGPTDPLDGLPTGDAQWANLCAKGYADMISTKFCAGTAPPTITSIVQLQQFLGLAVVPNPNRDPSLNPNVRVTLTGHSTGLGLRHVTPLNPRAFLFTPANGNGSPNPNFQVMAFERGEPFVELVARDPQANTLRFFLLRFHPACEDGGGCNHADLLTPTIESGWTRYTLYDDATIANTTLDCLNCHEPGGPGTKRILRMQEFAGPWMHWFYEEHPTNSATMDDFHAMHGSADYAGIPSVNVDGTRPIALQRLLTNNGFGTQPNAFDTATIEAEMAAGSSATWNGLYAKAVAGLEIPPPYFGVPQTDSAKVSAMIAAYQQTIAGTLPRDQMPDIRDTLLDSALADMSIRPKPGLDGRGILDHMCRMCHNSRLDQSITRARFDVENLAGTSRFVKDEAIRRLQLPEAEARHMPPARFHTLSAAERDLAIQELSK